MVKRQDPPLLKYQRVDIDEDIENLEDYEPGGYHPVDLFDILDGRFEVIYKLGFGGIAMVWLCYEFDAKRWRAVKINAASHSSDDCAELKILEVMKEKNVTPEQLDAMHIVVPWETFWIDGPNGRHLCSVMPVLGPRLSTWRDKLGMDYDTIDKMCYQFTEGLSFLHGMGIAHGDFRPANILTRLKCQSLDNISVDEMKELLEAPDMEEILTLDDQKSIHAPEEVVSGVCWDRLKHLISDDVAIVDFGEAYRLGESPLSLGIPRQYGAPEIVFGGPPTGMSDIWSLAYTLMEFRLGCSLISSLPAIVWRMERFAGPVPCRYRPAAVTIIEEATGEPLQKTAGYTSTSDVHGSRPITENIEELNTANENLAEGTDYTCPLEVILGAEYLVNQALQTESDRLLDSSNWGFHRLPSHEVTLFADLLRAMFHYNPEKRLPASGALRHRWFTRTQPTKDQGLRQTSVYWVSIMLVVLSLLPVWLVWISSRFGETAPSDWGEACVIIAMAGF